MYFDQITQEIAMPAMNRIKSLEQRDRLQSIILF